MSFRTMAGALRKAEENGFKLFYPELGEKIETRLYKGRYYIIFCDYSGPEWRVKEVFPDGGAMSASFGTHRTLADALHNLRWLIQDEAHRKAGTGYYAGLSRKARGLR